MALLRDEAPEVAAAADAESLARGAAEFFSSRRVLLLHAGGESRRLPCYVPEGKLFAPLALPSGSALAPVVLDVLLSLYFRYPWAEGELILASGDVIVDFDTSTLPVGFTRGDLCGFGKPTGLQQGSRHGVFGFAAAGGDDGEVTRSVAEFLQKASVETLREKALLPAAAVSGGGEACAVDTGIFSMSPSFVSTLLGWAAATPCGDHASVLAAADKGALYCDFYLEVVSALLPQPAEAFVRSMAAGGTKVEAAQLERLHAALQPLQLRGAMLGAASFIHFGSLAEYPSAVADVCELKLRPFYAQGGGGGGDGGGGGGASDDDEAQQAALWGGEGRGVVFLNCGAVSVDGEAVAPGSARRAGKAPAQQAALEMCDGCTLRWSGGFHLCVGVGALDLSPWPLPDGICLDGRTLTGDGARVTLAYSHADTFKRAPSLAKVVLCGVPMASWLAERMLAPTDVWSDAELKAEREGKGIELWSARLFCTLPPASHADAAAEAKLVAGYYSPTASTADSWGIKFKAATRLSLSEINAMTAPAERDAIRQQLRRKAGGK